MPVNKDIKEDMLPLYYGTNCKSFMQDLLQIQVEWFHNEWVKSFESDMNTLLLAPRTHGKLLSDNTDILTTKGWKKHGDLKIGDFVYHPSGNPTKIVAVSSKDKADYVVTFRNGQTIRCHGKHEWYVYDRNKKGYTTLETKDMLDAASRDRSRYQVININPINHDEKELPLDPYYLGLWLGDGKSTDSTICSSYKDLNTIKSICYNKSAQWIQPNTGVVYTHYAHNEIRQTLKKLNLYKNKHIPEIYKLGSINQRLELLAGLIDSDGSLNKKRGRYRFVNINYNLIKDVYELVRSFGLKPTIYSQEPHSNGKGIDGKHICYTVGFSIDNDIEIPTRLKRKRKSRTSRSRRLGITNVEYKPNGEIGKCIQVDSDDGLYLAGRELIPTHNSTVVAGYIIWRIINNPDIRILVVTLNQKLADGIMNTVKGTFEDNEEVRDIFGDYKGSIWSQQEIRVKRRRKTGIAHREKTLRVCGKSAKIVGQHFDLIILDDIIDRDECKTPHKRKENIQWYRKEIKPMLLNNGKILVVGTRWQQNDIYSKFMRYKSFDIQKYQAVQNDEILPKAIKEPEKYKDKVKMLWDREPDEELGFNWDDAYEYIDENGMTAFQEQYQNKITQTEDNPMKEEWIVDAEEAWEDWIDDKNKRNIKLTKYIGVDLASKSGSDYFAVTVIGVDESKNIYVLDQYRGHKSMSEQLEIIKELNNKWNPELVAIESNATQRIITDDWKEKTNLPILQVKSSWVNDKWSRVHKLSIKFETGRVFFNPNWINLRDELISFPKGHEDCIDSFSFAVQASEEDAPIDWNEYESIISTKKSNKNYLSRV